MRHGAAAVLAGLLAVALATTVLARDEDEGGPGLRAALLVDGRCGTPADSLPVLVTAPGIQPGDVAGDVVVCVTSTGPAGRLSLTATELVDLDPACSQGEAAVDASCGGGGRGELSASLLQQVAVRACPATGIEGALERSLSALASTPLVLRDRLSRKDLLCVRLRLLYRASGSDAVMSQSDRAAWRYTFSLSP